MTDQPRQLAIVHDYDGLHAALRARIDELQIVVGQHKRGQKTFDERTGLPDGYASKLLAPVPMKGLGKISLGPMLTALGLKLVVVEDLDAVRQITSKLPRKLHANGSIPTERGPYRRRYPKLGSGWGRVMRARGLLLIPAHKRRQIARAAAKARWSKPRVVEV
jgi:hypothetical protein